VAHGVERKHPPLATFRDGAAVQRRLSEGQTAPAAFAAAVRDLARAIDADHDN
jgi:hypothetical protein